ncbi:DUF1149 family protein [Brochothrix campestris]|uniref:DUF1149 family protein n=1 Tax=Brochothrix campestris FSL F6-1037 TaxID=1265861 RepID=W7CWL3_9LIST|nr:DUF1149 family protein [Brochothrix campestris]EUJ41357.1 hypothetical protein BCAMP_03585 [Brochothrix campestris FSL F6-1037]
MQINRSEIKVETFNFSTPEKQFEKTTPTIETNIIELAPVGTDDNEMFKKGKICRLELSFDIQLEDFKVVGKISRMVQFVDYFEAVNEIDAAIVRELTEALLDYVQRMTYDVTEIAFDKPGYKLQFEANN